MDENGEIMDESTVSNSDDTTEPKTVKYTGHSPDKPILKDAKTGKFIAGTGSSGKGGRKKGSRDRVSQAMVDLATELVADRGRELFHEMADRDPAQALALVSKIISPEELRAVYAEERAEEQSQRQSDVRISVVAAPERLQDGRTQAQIEDQQRGLTQRVERVSEPVEEAEVVSTQEAREAADEEAARARREQQERLNQSIRAHGGLTGRKPRQAAPDTLEYRDGDELI